MKTRWRCVRGASAAVRQRAPGCTLIASHSCKRDTDLSQVRSPVRCAEGAGGTTEHRCVRGHGLLITATTSGTARPSPGILPSSLAVLVDHLGFEDSQSTERFT